MTDTITLTAAARERTGKGGARALRRQGLVPAIIYGGKEEPMKVSVVARELIRQLEHNPRFFSSLCELKLDSGKTLRVVPREAQLHPLNSLPLHIDFYRAAKGSAITVEVNVIFKNEEESPGLRRGGVLNIVRREVELSCPVDAIPDHLEVDLAGVDIGESIHMSHVTLPANVHPTITDRDFTICSIAAPSGGAGAAEDDEAEGEAEASTEEA